MNYKKKHIRIESRCNNNCVFCSMAKKREMAISEEDILHKLQQGFEEGAEKIVLSGGEPTLNKDLPKIIKYSKKIGYRKVQIVTNGRMLSNKNNLDKLIKSGLDEITFSIHGHDSRIHDNITRAKGSFEQAVAGIKNCINYTDSNLIINADVVVSGMNYKFLPKITNFLISLGIKEIDFFNVQPLGNASKNWAELKLGKDSIDYIEKSIRICDKNDTFSWISKFPEELVPNLKNKMRYEEEVISEISALSKLTDLLSEIEMCKKNSICKFCFMKSFCKKVESKKSLLNKKTEKDQEEIIKSLLRDIKNEK